MGKLTVYLGDEQERKLGEIRDALRKQILSEIPDVRIDLSKSAIVKMAIDKFHGAVVPKPKSARAKKPTRVKVD
ncbi:MAG: hypothetical protein ACE5OY_00160 [Candidatus Bathyarchaeia archaeon]